MFQSLDMCLQLPTKNLRSTNPALSPITRASPAITSARRVSNFSKLSLKSLLALCNLIDLLNSILKILLRWILLNEHVPTFLTVLMENLFKKDFEKVFQNFNRIASQKHVLKDEFQKDFQNDLQ